MPRSGLGKASGGFWLAWLLLCWSLLVVSKAFADEPVYPDDAFSRPFLDRLSTFEDLDGVGLERDVKFRLQHYAHNKLRLVDSPRGKFTRWTLQPLDVSSAGLVLPVSLRHLPVAVRFNFSNKSHLPMVVQLCADELTWLPKREPTAGGWQVGEAQRLEPGESRRLSFDFARLCVFGHPGARPRPLRLPVILLRVVVSELEPRQDYTLELGKLEILYPASAGVRVSRLEVPHPAEAGKPLELRLALEGQAQTPVDLEFRRHDYTYWRIRLKQAELAALGTGTLKIERTVPWYLPPATYEVGVVSGGYRAKGASASVKILNPVTPHLPKAERKVWHGRPTFFFNGKPFNWQGYSSYDYQPGNVEEFGKHGVNVFCIPCDAGAHVYAGAHQTWRAPGEYDFDELDERVCFSLAANPEGLIFLRVSLGMPRFWSQAHPEELVLANLEGRLVPWLEQGRYPAPSLASNEWVKAQEQALRALLLHCRRQPWARRLAGVWLTCEVTEEWFAWGANDHVWTDYSSPNTKAFASWAKQLPANVLESPVRVPSPQAREAKGWDVYPDTHQGRLAAAYSKYYSDLTVETLLHFAKVVKEVTEGHCLVGAFFGYLIELAGEPRQASSGQLALQKLLEAPEVDFLASVPLLDWRNLGNGYNPYCSATQSILAAGKLFCSENDLFSWLAPLIWHTLYDADDPRRGAILMHRRECAGDAVRGVQSQKFSLAASWHHDQALQEEFVREIALRAQTLKVDRTPMNEVAFLVDDDSFAWTPAETSLPRATHKDLLYALGRTGAPVGVWLLSDLNRLPKRVKFVVIAGAVAPQRETLAKLCKALAKGGRTYLVVGLPGLVDTSTWRWDLEGPADLLQLPVAVHTDTTAGKLLDESGKVLCDCGTLRPYGTVPGPCKFTYASGAGAFAARRLPHGGKLLWCALPPTSSRLLRTWLQEAGVHCYAPVGCFVHASAELVAVTAPEKATLPLNWPQAVSATDLFTGWEGQGRIVQVPFELGQTRLFKLTPPLH